MRDEGVTPRPSFLFSATVSSGVLALLPAIGHEPIAISHQRKPTAWADRPSGGVRGKGDAVADYTRRAVDQLSALITTGSEIHLPPAGYHGPDNA